MRRTRLVWIAVAVGACCAPTTDPTLLPAAQRARTAPSHLVQPARPLVFEENRGQAPDGVDFVARTGAFTAALERAVVRFVPRGTERELREIRLRCVGGSPDASPVGIEPNAARVSYLVGRDPGRWQLAVPTYDGVAYRGVYPGIDLVYRGNDARVEFDFEVAPGADPGEIELGVEGADDLRLDDGDLVATTPHGEFRQLAPVCFQEIAGARVPVQAAFELRGAGSAGFLVGAYDPSYSLTIDPVVEYATYLGGPGYDSASGVAVDPTGGVFVVGSTASVGFPDSATIPGFVPGSNRDAFVMRLTPAGALDWSLVLGGAQIDDAIGLALAPDGDVVVAGLTNSADLPTTTGSLQPDHAGEFDAFVLRLAPTGDQLRFLTYLGGSLGDQCFGVAVGPGGDAYLAGMTWSADFPAAAADRSYETTYDGFQRDGFVARVSADGTGLPFATYLGGFGGSQASNEYSQRLAVDASERVTLSFIARFVVGTPPPDMWDPSIVFERYRAYLVRLDTTATGSSALVAQLEVGGDGDTFPASIVLGPDGETYTCGYTTSTDMGTPGAAQEQSGGSYDGFVLRASPELDSVEWTTYLAGDGFDLVGGLALDDAGGVHGVGFTQSSLASLPTTAVDLGFAGGPQPAVVASLSADGTRFTSLGVFGGTAAGSFSWISFDGSKAWLSGYTSAGGMPATPGAVSGTYGGGAADAIVVRIDGLVVPAIELVTDDEPFHACNTAFDWTAGKQMRFEVVVWGSPTPAVATVLPTGAVYDTGYDPPRFTWTPTETEAGLHTIAFEATGPGGTTTCTLDVTVHYDQDGDALPDLWETDGYTHDNGQTVTLADLSAYAGLADFVELAAGADPYQRDIFVWVDWMAAPGDASHVSHRPETAALERVLDAFDHPAIPLTPGDDPAIRLHVLVSKTPIPHQDVFGSGTADSYDWTEFDRSFAEDSTMPEELSWGFHRAVFVHDITTNRESGISRDPGDGSIATSDFIVSLGAFTNGVGTETQQAGTFQHELGHNLGLRHGGGDNVNDKPNYVSVMNYYFQLTGLRVNGAYGTLDYSFGALPPGNGELNEAVLYEYDGLAGPGRSLLDTRWDGYGTRWWARGTAQASCENVNEAIDWNGSGGTDAADVFSDTRLLEGGTRSRDTHVGHDDWANLVFGGGNVGAGISVPLPRVTPIDELTYEEARRIAPAPPTKLKVHVAGKNQVVLTWKPMGPQKEWTYRIWRAIDGGPPVPIATTTQSNYQDRAAPRGTVLTYTITALDALGVESRASEAVEVTTR